MAEFSSKVYPLECQIRDGDIWLSQQLGVEEPQEIQLSLSQVQLLIGTLYRAASSLAPSKEDLDQIAKAQVGLEDDRPWEQ